MIVTQWTRINGADSSMGCWLTIQLTGIRRYTQREERGREKKIYKREEHTVEFEEGETAVT